MISEVTNEVVMWKLIAGAMGAIIPIIILVIWQRKMKLSLKPALTGAAIFFVFSQILESIPKAVFFVIDTPLSQYVWTHSWAYVLAGTLLAGIFEETGRYVAFRFVLKKYQNRNDSITYGIGHGGLESILVLGVTGISSIGMAAMINNGSFDQMMNVASVGQQHSMELQLAGIIGYGFFRMLVDVFERLVAMILHVALSVVVFNAVNGNKVVYLLIAIVMHALFDVPAALYQCNVLNRNIAEVLLLVCTALVACYAKSIYQKNSQNYRIAQDLKNAGIPYKN